jgi:hypothetical protein
LVARRTLAGMLTTNTDVSMIVASGSDSVRFLRGTVMGYEADGNPIYDYALHRWDFATATEFRLLAEDFQRVAAHLETPDGPLIVCGAGDGSFAASSTVQDGTTDCFGVVDQLVRWRVALPQTTVHHVDLLGDVVWLSTTQLVANARGGARANLGALIAIDPASGSVVERLELAIGASTGVLTQPRNMLGEGRCAGVAGVGAVFQSGESNGVLRYERVVGADGATCRDPITEVAGMPHSGSFIYDIYQLAEPAAGACRDNPHLVVASGAPGHNLFYRLWTTRAADCAIGLAP